MTTRQFLDSIWGAWLVLFLFALVFCAEVATIVAFCFAGWCLFHFFRWLGRSVNGLRLHLSERARHWRAAQDQLQRERQWARQQPEREAKARSAADAQKRRDDARAKCELLFSLHAPELADRFPRELFDDFAQRYLSDVHSPDYVEQRAQQLEDIIRQHLEKVQPVKKMRSLEELTTALQEEKQRIEQLPVDQEIKDLLLIELEQRFDELIKRFIREIQP
jgi:hypothetical protein